MWMSINLSKITDFVEREIVEVKRKTWVDGQYSEGQLQALNSVKTYIKLLDSGEKRKLYEEGLYDISTGEVYKV